MSGNPKKRVPKKYKVKGKKGGLFSFHRTTEKPARVALAPNADQLSAADNASKRERKGSLIKMRFSSFMNTITNITGRKNEIDLDSIADISHVQQHHKLDAKTFKTDSKDFEAVLKESGITGEDLVKHRDEVLHVIQTNMLNAVTAPPTKKEVHETFEDAVDVVRDDPIRYFTKESKIADSDNFEIWRCIPKPKTIIPFLIKHRPVSGVSYVTAKICEVVSPVEVFSEIALLSLCKGHSNIVEYIYTYFSGKSTCLWIVCEYMESSIADILFHCETINGYREMGSPWKDKYISYVLREILQAVEFLHRHYRIHRNLKCENFLWNQSGQVKLTHFGDAVTLTAEESKRKSKINTDFWSPPELLKDEEYDRAVDIWSLGISLIELATGDPPFRVRETQVRAMLLIIVEAAPRLPKRFGSLPAHYSEDCEHLVELMCNKDPEERPSAEELLMHPYFQNACAKEDFAKYAKRMKQGFL